MRIFIILFFVLFSNPVAAQVYHHKVHISLGYSYGAIDTSFYNCGSLQAEVFVSDHIGIKWNFDYLLRDDEVRQFHAPMGIVGGPFLIGLGLIKSVDGDSTTKGWPPIIFGVLALALPDGVSFHAPIGTSWDIAPYANLLGIDFVKNRLTGESGIKYACSFGSKFTYILNDVATFSLFGETRKTAGIPWSYGGGISVGVLLGSQ